MGNNVRVKLKLGGINKVMKSGSVQRLLHEQGEQIARRAGEGFGVSDVPARYVARTFVSVDPNQPVAVKNRAHKRQREQAVLQKAVFQA